MTPEEALKFFKGFMEYLKLNNEDAILNNNYCKASLQAIEALEKQIQKKPQLEADGYYDGELVYDTWICPECGEYYEIDYNDYKYCPECGQRIDWSEVYEED